MKNPAMHEQLLEKLVAIYHNGVDPALCDFRIPTSVYTDEDLWVCAQIQRGVSSGANAQFTYGIEEAPIEWWHAELDGRVEALR